MNIVGLASFENSSSLVKVAAVTVAVVALISAVAKAVFKVMEWAFRPEVPPIHTQFTSIKTIEEQRAAHNVAVEYLSREAAKIGAIAWVVSPPKIVRNAPGAAAALNPAVFRWQDTQGVTQDIYTAGSNSEVITVFGVASQANGSEAPGPFTPEPGGAVRLYQTDHTQGPAAQLAFPNRQVELINNAANLGFNGLVEVLNERTKAEVKHGYLRPTTSEKADLLAMQLLRKGHLMQILCIGNIPKAEGSTQKVYEMLVTAPAFGQYDIRNSRVNQLQKNTIASVVARHAYRAQFEGALCLSRETTKPVIFKPTTPGLGVFGNSTEVVADAFKGAALEYSDRLAAANIQVHLQVYQSRGQAMEMANQLGLQKV